MRGTTPPAVTPAMYLEIFEQSATGQLVLEDLLRMFTQSAVTEGGIDAVLKTYQRMGQRRVLDHIIKQINRAQGVPETTEGEDRANS